MARHFTQDLTNLVSEPDAMRRLKSVVKDFKAEEIDSFVTHLCQAKASGHAVSLFCDLVRAHSVKIAPHIDMIRTLRYSERSLGVEEACSKVVSVIAKFGTDRETPQEMKRSLMVSLCKPLYNALVDSQRQELQHCVWAFSVCLKPLLDCDEWHSDFDVMVASKDLSYALEGNSNADEKSFGLLLMELSNHNPLTCLGNVSFLVKWCLKLLDIGVVKGNFAKQTRAIELLNFLIKNFDSRTVALEIKLIYQEVDKQQENETRYFVKKATLEIRETIKMLFVDYLSLDVSGLREFVKHWECAQREMQFDNVQEDMKWQSWKKKKNNTLQLPPYRESHAFVFVLQQHVRKKKKRIAPPSSGRPTLALENFPSDRCFSHGYK